MRIGIDLSSVSAHRTGTGNYTYHLVRHLLDLDAENEYFLFYRPRATGGAPLLEVERANVHCVAVDARLAALYHQLFLPAALRRHGIDVYHSPGFFLPLAWQGARVVTIHDVNFIRFPSSWWRPGTRIAYLDLRLQTPPSAYVADRIITVSESSKQDIVRLLPASAHKITVIYHGAAPHLSAPPTADELDGVRSRFGGAPFFLYVGVISPQKNLERLIQAFGKLRAQTPTNVRLILAGKRAGEEYRQQLGRLVSVLGLDEAVVFTDYVDDITLRALYHTSLALVAPYLGEGFGLPVLEAMTCATPVITSRVSSLPEVGGDAVLYADPYDVGAIQAAMARLLGDAELRAALGRQGARRAAEFSWTRAAAQTLAVYSMAYRQRRSG